LNYYNNYLEIESQCAVGWYNRGIVLEQLKKHIDALDSYRRSASVDETFSDAWFNLGNLYADMDDYNQAIDCFKKVINLQTDNSSAFFNLGVLYEDLNDFKQAIYFYSKSLQCDISSQEAYLGRGNCFYKINDLGNALQDFQSALAFNDNPDAAWSIPPSTTEISVDEICLQKIRSYENRGAWNLDTIEFSDLIQNYIAVGKYNAAISLISGRTNQTLAANDLFLLAKIHFMRNNNFLGHLYLHKSFYINKELIEIFSKMFPKVTSSRLFNELFGFKK
jgi:tetratricopeptide (TPR) repeat protein